MPVVVVVAAVPITVVVMPMSAAIIWRDDAPRRTYHQSQEC